MEGVLEVTLGRHLRDNSWEDIFEISIGRHPSVCCGIGEGTFRLAREMHQGFALQEPSHSLLEPPVLARSVCRYPCLCSVSFKRQLPNANRPTFQKLEAARPWRECPHRGRCLPCLMRCLRTTSDGNANMNGGSLGRWHQGHNAMCLPVYESALICR